MTHPGQTLVTFWRCQPGRKKKPKPQRFLLLTGATVSVAGSPGRTAKEPSPQRQHKKADVSVFFDKFSWTAFLWLWIMKTTLCKKPNKQIHHHGFNPKPGAASSDSWSSGWSSVSAIGFLLCFQPSGAAQRLLVAPFSLWLSTGFSALIFFAAQNCFWESPPLSGQVSLTSILPVNSLVFTLVFSPCRNLLHDALGTPAGGVERALALWSGSGQAAATRPPQPGGTHWAAVPCCSRTHSGAGITRVTNILKPLRALSLLAMWGPTSWDEEAPAKKPKKPKKQLVFFFPEVNTNKLIAHCLLSLDSFLMVIYASI